MLIWARAIRHTVSQDSGRSSEDISSMWYYMEEAVAAFVRADELS